ncbi:chorismate mutase [Burkholderia multivorans]|uniref:Chorismate mutase n=1 Tax=Burkholderia multivorans (strain ATCC 17616 / 249) TaxID=395019 RepID=A0A0H3KHP2_BURM1|nr:chorismate mutase [Burkholderia multivorans]ABX16076.1 chorismate mutase [Burkholderia multivorans ATCC 17616]AIO75580.1 putative chorismate mutase [Burkholderia multivorans]MBR7896997.1 chorismate mutase [Burkholderia multivorans]MBR8046271.1 chorismate mutase [Burkholderia multivorans]PRF52459.1 chorismate mutase [Burkholderia multivorans]
MKQAFRVSAAAVALGLALFSSSPVRADGDDTALTNLVALASQRLALAEPVARWKWVNRQPIEDRPREAALLAAVEQRAVQAGLDASFARTFFEDQIAASKEVQNALFATWRATQPPEGTPPDLATSTRPALDRLTQKMLAGLAQVAPLRDAPDCQARLARSIANWKALTRYDSSRTPALDTALSHVCAGGGASAIG